MRIVPKSWLRETPPVWRYPKRVRRLAFVLAIYTVSIGMIVAWHFGSGWALLASAPVVLTGEMLLILAWEEDKNAESA